MPFSYKHPRPALTVDTVIFGLNCETTDLQVLLVERGQEPFKGRWAIPGGFVNAGRESLDEAARRELEEECGITNVFLEQLYTFGDPDRDPREHVVTVVYYTLANCQDLRVRAGSDADGAAWFSIHRLPKLAFDHPKIIDAALERLRRKIRHHPVGIQLLPKKFTLAEGQRLYETVLGTSLEKRHFRKKLLASGVIKALNETQINLNHRAAGLYSFDAKAFRKLQKEGGEFVV